jgi:hypothetical protein
MRTATMSHTPALQAKAPSGLLPTTYVAAKKSLATCERIDECADWANKALALKSYAKQMKDESLEAMAQRIRDRAVRQGGKLLLKVQAARGGDRGGGGRGGLQRVPRSPLQSRTAVAKDAGLSPHQAKQMVRVAGVPDAQFEKLVERDKPATVKELAEIGIRKAEKIMPKPYRDEWIDWTNAVAHLAALPACGLDVLASRDPHRIERLRQECAEAFGNLNLWRATLEKVHATKTTDNAG